MEQILKRIKKESLQIKGGDFQNWYDGLSPIEKMAYGKTLRSSK
tara:strand:+ start:1228 stop:1359 length:132 start_codon:yes stop_codon:yes gene_type:complete